MKRSAPQTAIALAALVSWLAAADPARALPRKEPWIELRTASFTLYSNAPEKTVRRVGEDLERLRDALSQLLPGLVLNSPPLPTSSSSRTRNPSSPTSAPTKAKRCSRAATSSPASSPTMWPSTSTPSPTTSTPRSG